MKRTEFDVAVRFDIQGKDETKKKRFGDGWQNQTLTLSQLVEHFKKGYAYAHPCRAGKKDTNSFLHADLLIADIDGTMTLEEALAHDFIKNFAGFIATTASHTKEVNRFRIVFPLERRVFEAKYYKALHQGMQKAFPSDPSASSAAQGFYGAINPMIIPIGNSLPESKINALMEAGMADVRSVFQQANLRRITEDTIVTTADRANTIIGQLSKGDSICCPFGTHPDKHPSAYIVTNQQGVKGVHCRSCGETQWTKSSAPEPFRFDTFDQLIDTYSGKANSYFEYRGLTKYDHELETSLEAKNFHTTNTEFVNITIDVPGIHFIKSGKGTGKTQALAKLMDSIKDPKLRKKFNINGRSILVGHRQSLIKESAAKLGMECYLDTKAFDTKVVGIPDKPGGLTTEKPLHYAVCLDSLKSRIRLQYEHYDVVILDESEQVFAHFLSRQMKAPEQNFSVLSRLIRNAKYVFCLDADIDRITLTGVVSCLRNHPSFQPYPSRECDESKKRRIYFHRNGYRKQAGTIDCYPSPSELKAELLKDIRSGKRCFVTSNNKKKITQTYQAIKDRFPEKIFRLVTSDNSSDEDTQSFIKHIKAEILNLDAVFASPTIGTGIDLTFPDNRSEIDVVYGFFDSNINTHFDIDQQLARVRHPAAIKVYIDGRRGKKKTDFHTVKREILDTKKIKSLGYTFGLDGAEWDESDHPFVDLYAEVECTRRKSMNFLKQHFFDYKKNQGWHLNFVEPDEVGHELGLVMGWAGANRTKKLRIDRLMQAQKISFQDYMRLKDNKRNSLPVSREERSALERYRIEHFYGEEISPALIDFDDEGKTESKIWLFYRVTDSRLALTHYSEISTSQVQRFEYSKTMKQIDFKQVMFLREAFASAGIFDLDSKQFDCTALYDQHSLKGFVFFMRKHEERLQLLFRKDLNEDIDGRSVNQLRNLLKLVGLKQKASRKNKGGGISRYSIDPATYNLVQKISSRINMKMISEPTGE